MLLMNQHLGSPRDRRGWPSSWSPRRPLVSTGLDRGDLFPRWRPASRRESLCSLLLRRVQHDLAVTRLNKHTGNRAVREYQGMAVARDAPFMPEISAEQSGSWLMTVMVTQTSLRISAGTAGGWGGPGRRTGWRARRGQPSRRMKLPGMRPAAWASPRNSTLRGRNRRRRGEASLIVTLQSTRSLAMADHGAPLRQTAHAFCRSRPQTGDARSSRTCGGWEGFSLDADS